MSELIRRRRFVIDEESASSSSSSSCAVSIAELSINSDDQSALRQLPADSVCIVVSSLPLTRTDCCGDDIRSRGPRLSKAQRKQQSRASSRTADCTMTSESAKMEEKKAVAVRTTPSVKALPVMMVVKLCTRQCTLEILTSKSYCDSIAFLCSTR